MANLSPTPAWTQNGRGYWDEFSNMKAVSPGNLSNSMPRQILNGESISRRQRYLWVFRQWNKVTAKFANTADIYKLWRQKCAQGRRISTAFRTCTLVLGSCILAFRHLNHKGSWNSAEGRLLRRFHHITDFNSLMHKLNMWKMVLLSQKNSPECFISIL